MALTVSFLRQLVSQPQETAEDRQDLEEQLAGAQEARVPRQVAPVLEVQEQQTATWLVIRERPLKMINPERVLLL